MSSGSSFLFPPESIEMISGYLIDFFIKVFDGQIEPSSSCALLTLTQEPEEMCNFLTMGRLLVKILHASQLILLSTHSHTDLLNKHASLDWAKFHYIRI